MAFFYFFSILSFILSPFIRFFLIYRLWKGKEEKPYYKERFGYPPIESKRKGVGPSVWFHGASVGEVVSLIPVIKGFKEKFPHINIILTTGTITAKKVAKRRLGHTCFYQYAPFDVIHYIHRFLKFWKPILVVFAESEIWPLQILYLHRKNIPFILLNGSLSKKTFKRWNFFFSPIIFGKITQCFAPSFQQVNYFKKLGVKTVKEIINIKFLADPLPVDQSLLESLKETTIHRPLWVAASTHPGEEILIIKCHKELKKKIPNILTIIIPRHPSRCLKIGEIMTENGCSHSNKNNFFKNKDVDIFLVDSIGELGTFYSLTDIVFMGGTLVPIGGHNPIEPALFKCGILWGPYNHNFDDITERFEGNIIEIENFEGLYEKVRELLNNQTQVKKQGEKNYLIVSKKRNFLEKLINELSAYIEAL